LDMIDYEYRKRVKRTSLYWGIIIGLNTAVQYLQQVLERPDTAEVFLKMAQEIREAVENDYYAAKLDEKEYAVEHGYIESEDEDDSEEPTDGKRE